MKIVDGALNEQNQQYERRPLAAAGDGITPSECEQNAQKREKRSLFAQLA
jgi:hypothetical protein